MKSPLSAKNPLYAWVIFFSTFVVLSIGYALSNTWTPMSDVSSGNPLTAMGWNNLQSNVGYLSGQIAGLIAGGWSPWTAVTGGIGYSAGKVGIGTTSPSKDLHIYNTVSNAEIDLQSTATTGTHWGMYHNALDATLRFWHSGGGDALTLTKDAKVGIGNSNPINLFEVGNASIGVLTGKAFALSNTTGNSTFGFGQSETARARLSWIYNATEASGYTVLGDALGTHSLILQDIGGNVGIGTTSPSAKLEVNGTLKIADGTQGVGKVLTSDVNGLATWSPQFNTYSNSNTLYATNVTLTAATQNLGTAMALPSAGTYLIWITARVDLAQNSGTHFFLSTTPAGSPLFGINNITNTSTTNSIVTSYVNMWILSVTGPTNIYVGGTNGAGTLYNFGISQSSAGYLKLK